MGTHVMLSMDIEKKAPDSKRAKFYLLLEAKGWTKLDDISTTWTAEFKSDDDDEVKEFAEKEVLALAQKADVIVEAWMQPGNNAPIYFRSKQRAVTTEELLEAILRRR